LWVKSGKAQTEHNTSALPPKPDIAATWRHVRDGPLADIVDVGTGNRLTVDHFGSPTSRQASVKGLSTVGSRSEMSERPRVVKEGSF
jgi:hypothetical protein